MNRRTKFGSHKNQMILKATPESRAIEAIERAVPNLHNTPRITHPREGGTHVRFKIRGKKINTEALRAIGVTVLAVHDKKPYSILTCDVDMGVCGV